MTQELGRYLLLTRLATGGMAEIFLAVPAERGGPVAPVVIKRILPHLADSPDLLAMFHNEAEVAARIAHPNVCRLHELGEERGQHFMVMEYLEGVTFARLRADHARARPGVPFDVRLAASLVAQACAGLHHAHELAGADGRPLGLVHRDVSPQNLMVTTGGVVKVLDFGIAKVEDAVVRTQSGVLKGKFEYMSPEQIAGRPVDRRADLFALGAVLHELVAGKPLFDRPNVLDVTRAIAEQPIPRLQAIRPDTPAALDELAARALARAPDQRPATARDMADELARAVEPMGGLLPAAEVARAVGEISGETIERRAVLVEEALRAADEERELAVPAMPTERVPPSALPTAIDRNPLGRRMSRRRVLVPIAVLGAGAAATALAVWLARGEGDGGEVARAVPPDAAATARVAVPDAAVAAADAAVPDAGVVRPPPRPRSARPGFFSIDSEPYATIYIDGKRIGDTPLYRVELAPGRHTVRAVCSCGKSRRFPIRIREGTSSRARRLVW
ncbi:MAG TPA: serine/threonine-protein kinase [Kofleriaceae bacterium]|nr:serine/threonine-protein kinase [Kofleriaceae bacterium]